MVGDELSVSDVHLPSITVTISSSFSCELHSNISFPSLHHGHHYLDAQGSHPCQVPSISLMSLWFELLVGLSVYELYKWDASSSIPTNTSHTCRVLWLMVFFIIFKQLGNRLRHHQDFPCRHATHGKHNFGKITSLLASYNG